MLNQSIKSKDAIIIPFNEYTVFYYSQSNPLNEAAYINCFMSKVNQDPIHVGTLVFTYPNGTTPPGQETADLSKLPTNMIPEQKNRLEPNRGYDYFVMYYDLSRFDDVINLLRYAFDRNLSDSQGDELSMMVSANPEKHIWALCNNLHPAVGAQYHQ